MWAIFSTTRVHLYIFPNAFKTITSIFSNPIRLDSLFWKCCSGKSLYVLRTRNIITLYKTNRRIPPPPKKKKSKSESVDVIFIENGHQVRARSVHVISIETVLAYIISPGEKEGENGWNNRIVGRVEIEFHENDVVVRSCTEVNVREKSKK